MIVEVAHGWRALEMRSNVTAKLVERWKEGTHAHARTHAHTHTMVYHRTKSRQTFQNSPLIVLQEPFDQEFARNNVYLYMYCINFFLLHDF